jgi:NodT family efflux transporter outer membrane factor (OMF) lipoprotein
MNMGNSNTTGVLSAVQKTRSRAHLSFVVLALLALCGCNFAPKYKQPPVETGTEFKELTPKQTNELANWKPAAPAEGVLRGNWWELFNDSLLNELQSQIEGTNQTIAAAIARVDAARALAQQSRANLFPLVAVDPSVTRSQSRLRTANNVSVNVPAPSSSQLTLYNLPATASWEPDLWGWLRNAYRADRLEAEATQADLENVRLTAHADLAADYYQLRALDAQKQLLDSAVTAYQESYDLARARYETGIASEQDVVQAQTQLATTRAQATDTGIQRAQFEHAIAVLLGRPPSEFTIQPVTNHTAAPSIPIEIPSTLLQRRPDIAAAERRVMEMNATIGVARAAYFPNLALSGSAGYQGTTLSDLTSWPNFVWSVGGTLTETIFDAGRRRGVTRQAWANYHLAVANYRQAVLTSFREVEDQLAALRLLATEVQDESVAVQASQRYLTLASDRYKLGIDSYLNVITAQTTLLGNQRTSVALQFEQLTATVQLIRALGGGWSVENLKLTDNR